MKDGALHEIWVQSRDNILARVTVVEEAVAAALGGVLDDGLRDRARREAHMLAGSAGTFGFAQATEHARELERALEAEGELDHDGLPRLAELVGALRAELEATPSGEDGPADEAAAPGEGAPIVVVGDTPAARALADEVETRGVVARRVRTLGEAGAALREPGAEVLVLDLGTGDTGEALDVLADASLLVGVAVLTDPTIAVDRVEVARRGGRLFLPREAATADLVDAVLTLRNRLRPREATVLAVDDDPAVSAAVSAVLGGAGLRVVACEDPALFWETLEQVFPDLVVLDVDMPLVSGLELCRALRADARWERLPVMILTARTDQETIVDVFAAGSDDYVAKPFVGPELLARIQGRLDRVRLFREISESDPLTGLANRRSSHDAMTEALTTSSRLGSPLSLSLMDLDGFKQLNDRHGHAAGDAALRAVAGLLKQRFAGMASVARWGGDEFVVGLPGLTATDAREQVADFLEELREAGVGVGDQVIRASAGVAEYPRDAAALDVLHRAADRALYSAKAAGGDRVHDAAMLQGDPDHVDVVLVEDDPVLCELVEHALRTRGYTTRRYMDGLEASVDLAAARPEVNGSIVLLDWDLPSVDGLRILKTMASNGTLRRSRVIMLTGRATEGEVLQALEAGASDHVAKPFSIPVLMQRVRHALARPQ